MKVLILEVPLYYYDEDDNLILLGDEDTQDVLDCVESSDPDIAGYSIQSAHIEDASPRVINGWFEGYDLNLKD